MSNHSCDDHLGLSRSNPDEAEANQKGSMQAAIARTASRSMALYFARPVRLFRPSKVNGWQTLKNLASQQGTTLSSQYLRSLIKLQGIGVIPKHFIPPMIVNAALGTVLWGAYGETSVGLEPYLASHTLPNAAISGAVAGACQALVAAPAENVRILLEHGFGGHSWSCAWKEVFREKVHSSAIRTKEQNFNDIRQLRSWLHDVGQMAGRGWNGWGWGLAKDTVGFAAFFLIFELSRRAGTAAKELSLDRLSEYPSSTQKLSRLRSQLPAIINGITLVTGGVFAGLAYELTCRPFDIARRVIYLERLERHDSSYRILKSRLGEGGLAYFFQTNLIPQAHSGERLSKWTRVARTIGRVGPWGLGFLVWEAYGSSGLP